ncbi:MAG: GSU2403 family nucleotidyltransferase fold protein [Gemmatimonadaceae bacterium]
MSDDLKNVLGALAPYLPDIVIIGGWVPQLYRLYGGLPWRTVTSRTTELDVLVEPALDPAGRPKIRDLLEAIRVRPARREAFPADWVSEESEATVVEFIMENPGPALTKSPRLVELQSPLGAIVLNDVAILRTFSGTLTVQIDDESWEVRVPTLGAWAIGKALSFGARRSNATQQSATDKRAKDLVYLRDLLYAGPEVVEQVTHDVKAVAASRAGQTAMKRAVDQLKTPHEDILVVAALQLSTRDNASAATAHAEITGIEQYFVELLIGHFSN